MPKTPSEELETFLARQEPAALVGLLLELAAQHEVVQKRLSRLQLADRPEKLAADFRRTLTAWRRSKRFLDYRRAGEFARELEDWLGQVERELLPRDPAAALALFEQFIEADGTWLERADDSDGSIGDAVRTACGLWLRAAARAPEPPGGWVERLTRLARADEYGARAELLGSAGLLLDESQLRGLVGHYQAMMTRTIAEGSGRGELPIEVFQISGTLSLLAGALRDPDVHVRAVLSYSPTPNEVQRHRFVREYLEADRPADALEWLSGHWGHLEDSRRSLLADALGRLGRREESAALRYEILERTLSVHDLQRWLEDLPETAHADARERARKLAIDDDRDPIAAARLLLEIGEPLLAESRLVASTGRIDGNDYGRLVPLAEALGEHGLSRGEALVYRALLQAILDRAYTRAYGHAARYWRRLSEIADSGVELLPLTPHDDFAAQIRQRHGRKIAFWTRVNAG